MQHMNQTKKDIVPAALDLSMR